MPHQYPLVHIDDVKPENMDADKGWRISQFRLPISKKQGSATTAFHSRFLLGASHKKHLHTECDELVYYISGRGVAGAGKSWKEVRGGSFRLNPKGVEHWFWNRGGDEPVEMVGFYLGAGSVEETGYIYRGDVAEEDVLGSPGYYEYPIGHLDGVKPENMNADEGWCITDFRLPLSKREGCASTLFRARFKPGAVHNKHHHANCDEIYCIISGLGLAGAGDDRVEVRGGHFHFIPKGVEHWLHNLSGAEPIEVVGVYLGAESVEETGYVYTGDVTEEDIQSRTA
jgi:mannose-6-phosphate isomerase-like protein (cupin superfamily)